LKYDALPYLLTLTRPGNARQVRTALAESARLQRFAKLTAELGISPS